MNLVQVFALLAALTHLALGTLERFFYDRTAVRVFLTTSPVALGSRRPAAALF